MYLVTDSHFSSIPCIRNIYAKENKWAEKNWVGLCFTLSLGFSLIKLLGENVNWGRSRPVSVRWVILCGGSGYSQSKPPATSRGQCRSAMGPGEKWKKRSRPNSSSSMTGVCFYVFVFRVYLNPSLPHRETQRCGGRRVPGGTARWLHLMAWRFQDIFPLII